MGRMLARGGSLADLQLRLTRLTAPLRGGRPNH